MKRSMIAVLTLVMGMSSLTFAQSRKQFRLPPFSPKAAGSYATCAMSERGPCECCRRATRTGESALAFVLDDRGQLHGKYEEHKRPSIANV